MDAKRERELAELKEEITEAKKKEATALQLVGMDHPAYMIAAQRLNELEKQKTCLIEQQGESHLWKPCHAWQSRNLPVAKKSWTFLETIKRVPCIPI